ncbi:MAG TPA: MtnX-like HAD-IB family phosphatase [Armatimonadota bacterium]|nr:MtnX-like HAD-IB family phosphatase [Armatimonadota bacterium]
MNTCDTADWIVFCDFDGTITTRDTCDAVLSAFASPLWRELDERFHAGELSGRECMARQFATVTASEDQVARFLRDHVRLDPAFPRLVQCLQTASIPLYIVSDGFDLASATLLQAAGLGHIPRFANHIEFSARGARVTFPYRRDDCISGGGNCKCSHVRSLATGRQVMIIGDGYSDRCFARLADLVFAKRVLLDHCRQAGIPHVPYQSFEDLIASPEFQRVVAKTAGV